MALQLKNKVDKEKKETSVKGGKYKRKRNVFGKRLTRFGLIGTIIGLVLAFAIVKVVFTLQQNNRQKKIDNELADVEAKIKEYKRQINRQVNSYENVGELIATLPVSFDQQATSLDLDRMVILSGMTESTTVTRSIDKETKMPFECNVDTVKAVRISMTLYGAKDDIDSSLSFIKYITDYKHENFYYVDNIDYKEDSIYDRSSLTLSIYTFYNDIELTPTNQTTETTTNK